MKDFYPSYYKEFRCIAADCPDSCCQGWDVVIDSDTESRYNTVQGDIGDKLRAAIYTDADGDRVFRLKDGQKCPFWGEDKLCDIYRELGEKYLCVTCARFPRLSMDYTVFCERSLALACPEAARLITEADNAYDSFDLTDVDVCDDYSPELMTFLLRARKHSADILSSDLPLKDRLTELIRYNADIQNRLTEERSAAVEKASDCKYIFELYSMLEYIDPKHREMILNSAVDKPDFSAHEAEYTRLAMYWLYRLYLNAIDTADVLSNIAMTVCSLIVTAAIADRYSLSTDKAAQIYSKEFEQSYENTERLYDEFKYDPLFSAESLIDLL